MIDEAYQNMEEILAYGDEIVVCRADNKKITYLEGYVGGLTELKLKLREPENV